MSVRACISVRAGKPISQSEWKDPAIAEQYRRHWGKKRCVCARQGTPGTSTVPMSALCARAELVHKVGNTIFTSKSQGGNTMSGKYDEIDALDASLDEFAALIEMYNLKAVGIGAGVGGIAGVAIPGIMRVLPVGKWWDWIRMLSPLAVTGVVAALVAKKQPVVAVALVAGGSALTVAVIANKFLFKDLANVGISMSPGAESLIAGAIATVSAAKQKAALEGLMGSVGDYQLTQGNDDDDDSEDLPFGDTDLFLDDLGRIEPLFANEYQSVGLEGMTLVDENTYAEDASYLV